MALPADWEPGDPGDMVDVDPDVIDRRVPGAPDGLPIGARMWHYGRTEGRTFSSAEEPAGLQGALLPADREQLRREEIAIPGAEEGFLLQLGVESPLFDQPVRFTYVVGLREDGVAILLSIAGTAEQIGDEVIESIVDTFRLTGPVEASGSDGGTEESGATGRDARGSRA